MKKYSKIRYLLEQAEAQSEIEVFGKLNNLLKAYNGMNDNDKKALSENPNSEDGMAFWGSVEKILDNVGKVKGQTDESQKYISTNKDAIAKNINELNSIASEHPAIYDAKFKDTFETILANPLYSGDITIPAPDVPEKPEETAASTEGETKPTGETPAKPTPTSASTYTGVSIVDFLDQSGKPSDFASRKELATKMGIPEYKGTASQNLLMLNALRGGQTKVPIQPAQKLQPEDKPMSSVPSIKFGDMKFPPYVDMGGGRYVRATPEQIADPNLQLYIQNPKKGAGEYNKANFVKVRREKGGQEIRRQSQFGGAVGSASNLLGDIGKSLSKPFGK